MKHLTLAIGGLALAVAVPAFTPAFAQAGATGNDVSEDITVTGRYGADSAVRSLSQAVSYADLDLSTKEGRDELRRRVNLTARYLCDQLGESNTTSSPVAPSCRDAATRDALGRVGTIEAGFAPRGTTWTRPAPWKAPYTDEWARRYP